MGDPGCSNPGLHLLQEHYPAVMRSSGFAEFLAQLEQESQGCLALTVLRYCQSAGWQRLASLRAKGFWITAPSEFQARYCPSQHQHFTVTAEP